MAYEIACECGYTAKGETEEELVADCQAHIEKDHPELRGSMTREDMLARAKQTS